MTRGVAALAAGPLAGFDARGTAVLYSSRGEERGTITLAALGGGHCRIKIDLGSVQSRRGVELALDGRQARSAGPPELVAALAGVGWAQGCALLPESSALAALGAGWTAATGASDSIVAIGPAGSTGQLSLTLDPSTGLPAAAAWTENSHAVSVTYSGYQEPAGTSFPAAVAETVDGALRLAVQWDQVTPNSGYTAADFALPPPKRLPKHAAGGGQ